MFRIRPVYDDVLPVDAEAIRQARAILREQLPGVPEERVARVVRSFQDDPARLRPARDVKEKGPRGAASPKAGAGTVALVVSEGHAIHHVHERGYVEAPARVEAILRAIGGDALFVRLRARRYPERHVRAVHDADFVDYLRRACAFVPAGESVYPYVLPVRNAARPPKDLAVRAGYYCIDTFTPLNGNAYIAARRAVDCALRAADALLEGYRLAYALVRPPGHHAERRAYGGFCYFNSNAIAAEYLSAYGKVAILDVDYHHGNGQQDIFYRRADVLTVSIHGHPSLAYPHFSGFEDERGEGAGDGCNFNLPLPERVGAARYREALRKAIRRVEDFRPWVVVVALGLDTARFDPTGTWALTAEDFAENGRMIGGMGLPVLVVQEGGYRTRTLGRDAFSFIQGLVEGPAGRDRTGPQDAGETQRVRAC